MITDAIRKSTDQYGLPRMMTDGIRAKSECVTWAKGIRKLTFDYAILSGGRYILPSRVNQ